MSGNEYEDERDVCVGACRRMLQRSSKEVEIDDEINIMKTYRLKNNLKLKLG